MRDAPHWFFYISEGSGLVLAVALGGTGWMIKSLVSWITWSYGRRLEEHDMMMALRAEIEGNVKSESQYAGVNFVESVIKRVRRYQDRGTKLKLASPSYDEDIIFDLVRSSLTRLPPSCLPPIVGYYNLSNAMSVLVKFITNDEFTAMPIARKAAFLRQLRQVAKETVETGSEAISCLDLEIKGIVASNDCLRLLGLLALTGALTLTAVLVKSVG